MGKDIIDTTNTSVSIVDKSKRKISAKTKNYLVIGGSILVVVAVIVFVYWRKKNGS